jgi:threonine/homoserine/homoserine lactone efflux protein
MAAPDILIAFLLTAAIFALLPGPAILYAAARTVAGGRRAGLLASAGIHLGGWVHVIAAAAGLSVIFHAVPPLYVAVKLGGAAYLVWLGIGMFRSGGAPEAAPARAPAAAFRQSVLVEVLNPKTAMFFVAFLPQFVDPAGGLPVWAQFLILGAVVNGMFLAADLVAVLFASAVVSRLKSSGRARAWMQRAGGAVLVALGLRLAADRG